MTAAERVQRTLERYDLWKKSLTTMQKLTVLRGDLRDETLGLGKERFRWLADWASIIFHVGAVVNHCETCETNFMPNVIGTKNALRVATCGCCKAFHYMSSLDVWDAQNPLMPLLPVLQEQVLGRLTQMQNNRYTPHYLATNTLAALADAPSIQYVPFDRVLLEKYIAFWKRRGFYKI